jgi:hypothetical protein
MTHVHDNDEIYGSILGIQKNICQINKRKIP